MSQKPTILSQYLPQPCGTSPRLTIFTHSTDPLYLIITRYEPKRRKRFKVIRGLAYECGRAWTLIDAVCVPQTNLPTQNYHIFPIPSGNIGDFVWYSISTACQPSEATSFTPPIKYEYKACPPSGTFVQVEGLAATQLGGDYSLSYANVIAGDPACRINAVTLSPTANGGYAFTATAVVRADPNAAGLYTGEMYLEINASEEFGTSVPFTTDRGQEIAIACAGFANLLATDNISVRVRQTGGTNLLQRPASLNASSQWSMTPM